MEPEIQKHNPVERKIKTDIVVKNTLRKKIGKKLSQVNKWDKLLPGIKNNKKRKNYQQNIKRYLQEIRKHKPIIKEMIQDLEKRIKEEMKYSEKEITDLEQMHIKEYDEMLSAQKLLIKAEQGKLDDKEKLDIAEISAEKYEAQIVEKESPGKGKIVFPKEYLLAKAKKKFRKEAKDADKVEKELKSEEKDKALFNFELKRMMMEKKILD